MNDASNPNWSWAAEDMVFAVTTDGNGNIESRDQDGRVLARVEMTGDEDGAATPDGLMELTRLTFRVLEGDAEALHLSE